MYLSARNNSSWVGLHGAELRDVVGQLLPGDEPDVLVLHVFVTPPSVAKHGASSQLRPIFQASSRSLSPLPRICYDVFSDYKAIRLQPQHVEYQSDGRAEASISLRRNFVV